MIEQKYVPEFPIDELLEHPDNPRRGDEDAIGESMAAHGFYGAVLVQASSRRIIAGNHRTRVAPRAARARSRRCYSTWTTTRRGGCSWSTTARTISRPTTIWSSRGLLEQLGSLDGTGYTGDDLELLLAQLEEPNVDTPIPQDERYTPGWIFDGLELRFDLDVAAPVDPAARTVPAKRFLTIHDDGLTAPWSGLVFMNPPYSAATAWAARWLEHPDGVALMPVSGAKWVPLVSEVAAFCFTPGILFETPFEISPDLSWPLWLVARGAGIPGLERIARRQNWPLFKPRRPRPSQPMTFRGAPD